MTAPGPEDAFADDVERPCEACTEVTWSYEGEHPIEDEDVHRALAAALELGGRPGIALAVVFVDDPFLTAMHAEQLDDPTPTDVIAFDLGEDDVGPAGELYVSVERARTVAARRGVDVARELTLYVVHGALHLCGFDDHDPVERERMRAAESSVMTRLGFARDAREHEYGSE